MSGGSKLERKHHDGEERTAPMMDGTKIRGNSFAGWQEAG
jgi:hypothetical protein